MTDRRFIMATGETITDGIVVWNNDIELGRVDFASSGIDSGYWDGWFRLVHPITGARMTIFNGERMTTRNPFTGQLASEAVKDLAAGN